MKTLWITRDQGSDVVFIWDKLPTFKNDNWGTSDPTVENMCPTDARLARLILGDQWRDDGSFCFRIEIASVTRVRDRAQRIVKELRGMAKDGRYATVIIEAADLIETLIQK